jgi:hypothetical protein
MPGFSFSPTMINQQITLKMKSGNTVSGKVLEVNPVEIVLGATDGKLIRINRDEVDAYTGCDDVKRAPDPLRLHVTRCCNHVIKCNGIKKIGINQGSIENFKECAAQNEYCKCFAMSFFDLKKQSQIKLLDQLTIGNFPEGMKGGDE